MNALIIEDEKLTADRLNKLIQEHTSISVVETFYSVKSAIQWLHKNECPELLFLDIQLGDGTGFDVLDSLKSYPQVIFTTAFDKYVLDAFKYNSVDYLLKPVKGEELISAIEKLRKVRSQGDIDTIMSNLKSQLQGEYKKKFLIKTGQKFKSVPVEEIAYFYSESSTSYLRTLTGESLIIDHSLDDLQKALNPDRYFRINRHMLVCDDHIISIDSYFNNRLLISLKPEFSEQVIVSREKVRAFKDWLDR
ncbi:two component transcriptional regulator, LytTR family [Ekhidna lutea]|uniref:Two component transcriptional regulator, LytTR family n=1 Tax=Ekhidna lutea TaxID=447679 RepID=A0A239JIG4_EKHLU|nr:LytTR family DNA-binding domain-containing protein [Ekhidna lutea]SNT05625.1 two component transcriptional regulator, LytTR family [Ekhidna lutea]